MLVYLWNCTSGIRVNEQIVFKTTKGGDFEIAAAKYGVIGVSDRDLSI